MTPLESLYGRRHGPLPYRADGILGTGAAPTWHGNVAMLPLPTAMLSHFPPGHAVSTAHAQAGIKALFAAMMG